MTQTYKYKNKPSLLSLMTHEKCVVVSVSAETLPSACICLYAVLGTFLGINIWTVVCNPQPITTCRVWGTGCSDQLLDCKHVGLPEARVLWAGEEGPTLNVVFKNSNRQILLVMPLMLFCNQDHAKWQKVNTKTEWEWNQNQGLNPMTWLCWSEIRVRVQNWHNFTAYISKWKVDQLHEDRKRYSISYILTVIYSLDEKAILWSEILYY